MSHRGTPRPPAIETSLPVADAPARLWPCHPGRQPHHLSACAQPLQSCTGTCCLFVCQQSHMNREPGGAVFSEVQLAPTQAVFNHCDHALIFAMLNARTIPKNTTMHRTTYGSFHIVVLLFVNKGITTPILSSAAPTGCQECRANFSTNTHCIAFTKKH